MSRDFIKSSEISQKKYDKNIFTLSFILVEFLGLLGSIRLQRFKFQALDIQADVDSLLTNILPEKTSPETCW